MNNTELMNILNIMIPFGQYCSIPSYSGDQTHDLVLARGTCYLTKSPDRQPYELTEGYDHIIALCAINNKAIIMPSNKGVCQAPPT